MACTARFDPFGNPLNVAGTVTPGTQQPDCNTGSTPDTFFYRNARHDPSSGDYPLGSRLYDPQKDSFLTQDSYRSGQPSANPNAGNDPLLLNTYTYVNGDPVNLADPTGHPYTTGCEDSLVGACSAPGAPSATTNPAPVPLSPCQQHSCSRPAPPPNGGAGTGGACPPGWDIGRKSLAGLSTCDALNTVEQYLADCQAVGATGNDWKACQFNAKEIIGKALSFDPADCLAEHALDAFCEAAREQAAANQPTPWQVFSRGLVLTCTAICLPAAGRAFTSVAKLFATSSEGVDLSLNAAQFGGKMAQHAGDFGFDVKTAQGKNAFLSRIEDIALNPDASVSGAWRGVTGSVRFFVQGDDVVVGSPSGQFITVLKGGINNGWVQNAIAGS